MTAKLPKTLVLSYFLLVIIELIAELIAWQNGTRLPIYIFKPLLMPVLIIILSQSIQGRKKTPLYKLTFGALIFSWFGDIFLMIKGIDINLFLPGLVAFLIAHIFYIAAFRQKPEHKLERNISWAPVLVIIYGFSLVYGLNRFGNSSFIEMKIPVIIYASIIMLMVISAIYRFGRVNNDSFKFVLIGALLFLFSDSMIAINRFSDALINFPSIARVSIMMSYTLAQYYIVRGVVSQNQAVYNKL